MAISDILEALTLGGAGAVRGYVSAKQEEEARAERERQREEDRKYREATLALQQRQFDAAEAARQRQDVRETQRDISEGLLRETRELPNMAAVRGTISDALKAAEESEDADLFADRGIGMAAKPAAGQTYAAQVLREQEDRGKGPSRMQTSMSFLDEVPEFTPSESFRELGTQEFRGVGLRPVTPEERRAIALEQEDLKRQRDLEALIDQQAALVEQRTKEADKIGYTGEDRREYIATGQISRFAPRTQGFEDRDPFGNIYSGLIRSFMQYNQGRMPTAAERADLVLEAAMASGMSLEEAQLRAGVGGGPPPPPPSDASEDVVDPILRAEKERQEQAELSRLTERDALARFNMLQNALDSGSYLGTEVTESMRRDILKEIRALGNRYNFPIRGIVEDIPGSGLFTPPTAAGAFGVGAIR